MEIDFDYLEYLRGNAKWTPEQAIFLEYLSNIQKLLMTICERLPQAENLTAKFRITPQSTGSNPSPARSDFSSRLSPQ